jgi:hypothetical protein
MNYAEILQAIKLQNPGMPQKDAQKKASEMHKKFQSAKEALAKESPDDAYSIAAKIDGTIKPKTEKSTTIASEMLLSVEKRIREAHVDINNIARIGREVMPKGEIVKHRKDGLNTLVTWEDTFGNRIPVDGYFVVWI